jgi:GNAT superfamily N-acetyltransferase
VEDSDALTQLRIQMRDEREADSSVSPTNFYQYTHRYFTETIVNGNFVAFVAIEHDQIIASSGICFYQVPPTYSNPSGELAYVMNIFTIPKYRKQGIATKLLQHIMEEAKFRKCAIVTLNASEMGKPLYIKYGFQFTENHMEYQF